ncbi:putative gamma-butyrobetaine dioxygenase [Diplonema papillatum]|nr:putative gamma-butyrobetaine dioxygenase [Diplonema papillatum]|eukprot:gene10236-15740_t
MRAFTRKLLQAAPCAVSKAANGNLAVDWGGHTAEYSATWLRLNGKAVLHSANQKLVNADTLAPFPAAVSGAARDGGSVRVSFADGAAEAYPLSFLRKHDMSPAAVAARRDERDPLLQKRPKLPLRTSFHDLFPGGSAPSSGAKVEEAVWELASGVANNGVHLVTDMPSGEDTVALVSSKLGRIMPTLYGETWTVEAKPKPINIAYTEEPLTFHMDLPYYESPPGIQSLHCVEYSDVVTGGDSIFVDSLACAQLLRDRHPEHFRTLCTIPATFQKDHVDRPDPAQFFFRRAHIQLHADGVTPIAVFWSPPFEGVLEATPADAERYYSAYRAFAAIISDPATADRYGYCFRLRPGDMAVFSNRRWLHSRAAFKLNGGRRKLRGAYVSVDDFANTYNNLALKHAAEGHVSQRYGILDNL